MCTDGPASAQTTMATMTGYNALYSSPTRGKRNKLGRGRGSHRRSTDVKMIGTAFVTMMMTLFVTSQLHTWYAIQDVGLDESPLSASESPRTMHNSLASTSGGSSDPGICANSGNHAQRLLCRSRLEELHAKLETEGIIEEKIRRQERLRSMSDPHSRKNPAKLKNDFLAYEHKAKIRDLAARQAGLKHAFPNPRWNSEGGSFPDLNVIGFAKTGSTHLYQMLQTHQAVLKTEDDWKEHCTSRKDPQIAFPGYKWHKYYFQKRTPGKQLVNGCLSISDLEYRWHFSPPVIQEPKEKTTTFELKSPKFFVVFRDPADWMWAMFNFFYDNHLENRPRSNGWTNATIHYRSPELFHEMVLSASLMKEEGLLKPAHYMFDWREDSVVSARRVRNVVGDDNVLFLRNEDMLPEKVSSSGLLERVSQATGLSMDGFDPKIVQSKTNCNSQKGLKGSLCDKPAKQAKGGYPITGNRPMLTRTRKLIYLLWHEECQVWAEEFNVIYPDCLNVMSEGLEY